MAKVDIEIEDLREMIEEAKELYARDPRLLRAFGQGYWLGALTALYTVRGWLGDVLAKIKDAEKDAVDMLREVEKGVKPNE